MYNIIIPVSALAKATRPRKRTTERNFINQQVGSKLEKSDAIYTRKRYFWKYQKNTDTYLDNKQIDVLEKSIFRAQTLRLNLRSFSAVK